MSRISSFFTALWLSSVAAHPGFIELISDTATGAKKSLTNELQAGLDPVGKSIAFIGGSLCNHVKPLAGVAYENFDKEPDMSKLTLVFMTSAKTVIYNLTVAPSEIPNERWYDPKLPFRIFLHGFTDNPTKDSFQTMRSAFFDQEASIGKVNILALDASSLIAWFYLRATTLVQFIGERLGATLAALLPAGLDPANIHLIGHSLGSHIAGFAGQQFLKLTGSCVGRISSLDPAGPCFGDVLPTLRVSKEDADFVDVIHSDAGVYGLDLVVGHVDFYPNSGSEQPNCLFQTCSHSRAWEYYAESVLNPDAFIGVQCNTNYEFRHGECDCNNTRIMGYGTPRDSRGKYYLQTFGEEPFGAGVLGMTHKTNGLIRGFSNAVKDFFVQG